MPSCKAACMSNNMLLADLLPAAPWSRTMSSSVLPQASSCVQTVDRQKTIIGKMIRPCSSWTAMPSLSWSNIRSACWAVGPTPAAGQSPAGPPGSAKRTPSPRGLATRAPWSPLGWPAGHAQLAAPVCKHVSTYLLSVPFDAVLNVAFYRGLRFCWQAHGKNAAGSPGRAPRHGCGLRVLERSAGNARSTAPSGPARQNAHTYRQESSSEAVSV